MLSSRTALLLLAALLIFVPWLCRRSPVIRRVAPLAVIQILGGVLLGPTGLGHVAPHLSAALFTPPVLAGVNGIATVGVLLFVFVSGLHLDAAQLRGGFRSCPGRRRGASGCRSSSGSAAGSGSRAPSPAPSAPRVASWRPPAPSRSA